MLAVGDIQGMNRRDRNDVKTFMILGLFDRVTGPSGQKSNKATIEKRNLLNLENAHDDGEDCPFLYIAWHK